MPDPPAEGLSVPHGDIKTNNGYDASYKPYKAADSWKNSASLFDIKKRLPVITKWLVVAIVLLIYTSSAKLVTRFNAGPTYQFVL